MALKAGLWKTKRPLELYIPEEVKMFTKEYDCQNIYKSRKLADDQSGKTLVPGYSSKVTIVLCHSGWIRYRAYDQLQNTAAALAVHDQLLRRQNQQFLAQEWSKP